MTLAPKGKKVHTQSEQRRRGDQAKAERQARQAARLAAKQEAKPQTASEAGERIHKASTSTQSSKPAASVAAKGMHAVASAKTSVNKTTTKEGSNAEDEK